MSHYYINYVMTIDTDDHYWRESPLYLTTHSISFEEDLYAVNQNPAESLFYIAEPTTI